MSPVSTPLATQPTPTPNPSSLTTSPPPQSRPLPRTTPLLALPLSLSLSFTASLHLPLPSHAAHPSGTGPTAALAQSKALQSPKPLSTSLFASEPLLVNPANMDIDHLGRVWVTEGANYRLFQKWGKLRPEGDRIVILHDTNHDGTADTAKTFYQGNEINSALGLCVLGDKVIVSCSPHIFLFTDSNHDDKADGPPQILFTGIKGTDHDHGAHAFVFGPDGKLYFNIGNEGRELRKPDQSLVQDLAGNPVTTSGKPYRQGLVFRCNADGSQLETLGWNFRNNYEVCVDSFGSLWQSDNDDDGNRGVRINFVMEFGNYGYTDEMTGAGWGEAWKKAQARGVQENEKPAYHWHQSDPGVVPNLLHTGNGSPTGILIYEGDLLPEPFRNQLIHCDAGPRVVRAYPVQTSGAGYTATVQDIITTLDTWFRPSDVCTAPDGSIYVADWNDAGVGGHYMADQKLETLTGRIYRVAPEGHAPVVPKLDVSTASGAAQALLSPNQATRYLAWTALRGMGESAESALQPLLTHSNPRFQARALQLLARLPGDKGSTYLKTALTHANPDIRITALRIARQISTDLTPVLEKLALDENAAVRREVAIALRHFKGQQGPLLWAQMAARHTAGDRWSLEALGIGSDLRADECLNAWLKQVGDQWNTPAGREIVWRTRGKKAPGLLLQMITDKSTSKTDRERYLRAFDFLKGPEKEDALLELATQPQ